MACQGNISKMLPLCSLQDPHLWDHPQHTQRVTVQPQDAVRTLTFARKELLPFKFQSLQRKLVPYIVRQTGLRLPYSLVLPLPAQDPRVKKPATRLFRDFLRATRLPALLCAYLGAVVFISSPCKLNRLLSDCRVSTSLSDLRAAVSSATPCAMTKNLTSDPPCQCTCNPASWFTRSEIVQVTGDKFAPLFSVGSNYNVQKSPAALRAATTQALNALKRALPQRRPFPFPSFADSVQKLVAQAGHLLPVANHTPTHTPRPTVPLARQFKDDLPLLRTIFLDKNTLCYCGVLLAFLVRGVTCCLRQARIYTCVHFRLP